MPTETPDPTPQTIDLPAKVDSQAAAHLLTRLLQTLEADLTIDASKSDFIGAQALQILLNARHHWALAGRSIRFAGASDRLIQQLSRFGTDPASLSTQVRG
jgi:anti-anti-sigma regulatory factor